MYVGGMKVGKDGYVYLYIGRQRKPSGESSNSLVRQMSHLPLLHAPTISWYE